MTNMTKRRSPSRFAVKRGGIIRRAREAANMAHGELATELGKTRTWVIHLENGDIEKLHVPEARKLIATLGVNPTELTEDPSMLGNDFLPEASYLARRVGRAWDQLPKPLQDYFWAQIQAYIKLEKEHPVMAQIMRAEAAAETPEKETK